MDDLPGTPNGPSHRGHRPPDYHLRKSAPSTQHQIDLARALVESTRELLRQLRSRQQGAI